MNERALVLGEATETWRTALGLCGLEAVEPTGSESALQAATEEPVHLLVLEAGTENGCALETVLELDSRSLRPPILLLDDTVKDLDRPSRGRLQIHKANPPPRQDDIVIARSFRTDIRREADDLPLRIFDYLLLGSLLGYSATLRFLSPGSNKEAEVIMVGGECWNTFYHGESGREALRAILGMEVAYLSLSPLVRIPRRREIHTEAHRELAEQQEAAEPPPPTDLDSYDGALRRGMAAALARDYRKAEASFQEALEHRPGDSRAEFNLQRVRRRLGV